MKICSIPNCGKKYCANGYCSAHNAKWKKYGNPLEANKSKWDGYVKKQKPCCNNKCAALVWKGKYCKKCQKRLRLHGDVNTVLPRGNKEIWKLAKNQGLTHKYKYSLEIFDKWTPQLAWMLGWAITDGCVEDTKRNLFSLMLKDREPLEIIQKLFKTDKPIQEVNKFIKKKGIYRKYYRLRICGKKVVDKFKEFGIFPRKTYITRVPKNLPQEYFYHFLRGVIEGDGCIIVRNANKGYDDLQIIFEIASGNKEFLEDIKETVKDGTISLRFNEYGKCFSFLITSYKANNLLNKVYENCGEYKLDRKYLRWVNYNLCNKYSEYCKL